MRSVALWLAGMLACLGQAVSDAPHYVEVKIPRGVDSANLFIRYVLDHDFGGWVQPRAEVSSYFIGTTRNGHAATRLKALLYAPGCAIQTLDLPLAGSSVQQFPFVCHTIPWVAINGFFDPPDGRESRIEIKYAARWAQGFLDLGDGIVTDIPMASVAYRPDSGRFHLSIPDLSQDPLAGADHAGELQVWAMEPGSGKILAQLTPVEPRALHSTTGGLKIESEYPAEIKFAMCGTPLAVPHDEFGFAIRQHVDSACRQLTTR
jgi:hypothetical protein